MQRLHDLDRALRRHRLRRGTLALDLGGVTVSFRSRHHRVARWLDTVYPAHTCVTPGTRVVDCPVSADAVRWHWRVGRPKTRFRFDGTEPFEPVPYAHAPAMVEWGLNWAIAQRAHWDLMIHAATLQRDGRALILPGRPGTGKSTLAAGLLQAGWQLLSDEFALVSLRDGRLYPLWRPISLKGRAEAMFRERRPERMSTETFPSAKGPVGFYLPSAEAGEVCLEPVRPAAVVILAFDPGAPVSLDIVPAADAFLQLAQNSFNYTALGETGFDALARLTRASVCRYLRYSDLGDATRQIADIVSDRLAL